MEANGYFWFAELFHCHVVPCSGCNGGCCYFGCIMFYLEIHKNQIPMISDVASCVSCVPDTFKSFKKGEKCYHAKI